MLGKGGALAERDLEMSRNGVTAAQAQLAEARARPPGTRAVLMQHSESSTGVLHDVRGVAAVTGKTDAILIVDAVSSLGIADLPMDAWGVDVVVAGHTHAFVNAWLPEAGGKKQALVVEAFSAGTAFGWVDLEVDRASGDVVSAKAAVQTAWADEGPGLSPDRASAVIQAAAEGRAFLAAHGIDLSGEQQTKTRTDLEFFAGALSAAGA